MTLLPGPNKWDLDRIRQLVIQNDLERGRIEYKRELSDGQKTLAAIAALANTFGGVVLVGIDEDKQGLDRLTGVPAIELDKLIQKCHYQLVPPYRPEIIPVKLDQGDKYVLAVVVDTETARRPVMLTQGNRVLVRHENSNLPADWYRLRDLFAEEPGTNITGGMIPRSIAMDLSLQTEDSRHDFGVRGRLWLAGPRGRSHQMTESARLAAIAVLNGNDSPVTGLDSGLIALMCTWIGGPWGSNHWQLEGPNSTQITNARWQGLTQDGERLTEARLEVHIERTQGASDSLTIQLDTLLSSPYRSRPAPAIRPFLDLGQVGRLLLDTLATLWGPLGANLSTAIFGQPLGPPAQLQTSLATIKPQQGQIIPLNHAISFGNAQLIPGTEPGSGGEFPVDEPDQTLLSRAEQEPTIRRWLTELCVNNGYQNVEQEIARHTFG